MSRWSELDAIQKSNGRKKCPPPYIGVEMKEDYRWYRRRIQEFPNPRTRDQHSID